MFRLNTSFGNDPLDECSVKVDLDMKQPCLSTLVNDSVIIKMERDVNDVPNVTKIPYQCPSIISTNLQKSFLNVKVVKKELEITPDHLSNAIDDNTIDVKQKSTRPCPI